MELAGRYLGTGFGSAPVHLMLPTEQEPEMSTDPFETMGDILAPRLPSPLKPSDYMNPQKPTGKFLTDSKEIVQKKKMGQ